MYYLEEIQRKIYRQFKGWDKNEVPEKKLEKLKMWRKWTNFEKLAGTQIKFICKTALWVCSQKCLLWNTRFTLLTQLKKISLPIIAVFNCTLAYTTEARNSKNQVSLFAKDDFFSTMKQSPWILVPSAKSFKSFETVIFVVCI